jgi:diguanylate cyclase (GGDEF)-like protein/PAS domain S-box-containing protein
VSKRFYGIRNMISAVRPDKARQSTARRARIALGISALLALLLLAWSTWDHIRAHVEREQALAVQAPDTPGKAMAEVPLGDAGVVLLDLPDVEHASSIVHGRMALGFFLAAAFLLVTLALDRWVQSRDRSAHKGRIDLRESELKLQAVLSATTDGIIFADLQGRIELFNPAAEMMFGRLTEDVLNANLLKLVPDFFSSENADSLLQQQTTEHAPPLVRETRGRHKGGKEFPVRLWVSAVRFGEEPHLLIVAQDLTEHERNEDHLVFLEQRDVLTGLLNRREFERRLDAILADPKLGPGSPHVLCHIDVDRFKLINDTCGHEAGDELLKQLAILVKAKLALAQLTGRLGGDEFVVLFQKRTATEVREICGELAQTVRNFLFTWRDQSFDVGISIGLAEFTPESESPSSALSKADVACHMAKSHGRDRIHTYNEGDVELIRHHGDMHLVSAISHALSEGRFHLHAQPIMPLAAANSQRRHFEILVRMVDETGTPMIPDQFIPAAERYILMPAVDRWIINRLFSLQSENLRAWHKIEPESFLFAVNLSGTSVTDEGFLRYLKRQFAEWRVPHQSICFEITETAAVRDLEHARAFMQELGALGCSFALDDFGTGLSSYSYLKELPVEYLKIDGSFVRDMVEDPVNYALVESITQIGHVLGLQTIAEWAEDEATLTQLRALNVDFAQGFGVGESVPLCDITLADTAFPPTLEGTSDDRRRSTYQSRRSAARST